MSTDWLPAFGFIISILVPTISGFAWMVHRMDARIEKMDNRISSIENRISNMENKLTAVDMRTSFIERLLEMIRSSLKIPQNEKTDQ
ncbi:hypothetical protein [Candidatus Rhabdochlamydia porcellionis]|uniref:Phage protein n=1 Tax=Candidatus Rhabdochlamydia porcellionis TaxID=225148 RepID=A0ABX8Z3B6_9BACT|nr:hypothetical protein [Candidatus Rhabdochlamydia porcellionis]QZA59393.1 hypothetical protein RHAB15C_0001279 [Candidatus Rhabdochlamydia porcellionis]